MERTVGSNSRQLKLAAAVGSGQSLRTSQRRVKQSVLDLSGIVLLIICLITLFPQFIFAAASVSVSGGTWDIGTKGAASESTSTANQWTVTNDNSGGTENIEIKVTSSGLWTASTNGNQSAQQFVLRKDNSAGQIITAADGNALVTGLVNNGTNSFGLYFQAPPAGSEEGAHTLTVTLTATNWVYVCGNNLTVTHTAGAIAPVTKTVTYGTVLTNLAGPTTNDYKCWITQNLGSDNQAGSATDATEASAGWYWQFNRQQGYMHDGTTLTPAWTITSIVEDSNWTLANDPCALLLGTGWRLPTSAEWTNADATGGWNYYNDTYASVLKLHAAGVLSYSSGALAVRGGTGDYWSSTQFLADKSGDLVFTSGTSAVEFSHRKASGYSVRCLKD